MAKPRTPQATRNKSGGGFLLGVFVGLLIGLAIALGIAFYLNRTALPFSAKSQPAAKEGEAGAKPPAIAGMPQESSTGGTTTPKFDFYKILPRGEEPVTEKQLKERMHAAAKGQASAGTDVYFIQAGSFQNPAEADNQKARLAILGIDSSVEPAALPDKGTWYRVRIGPYTKLDDINRVRQTLAQNGITASIVKLKNPSSAKAN
ncbi:MAG TPA: SPOR domain-containing protein [Burkholderiales bacterium]|nr:SPOR domain-containing protein [Burkholderiales bacterium]